MSRRGTIFWLVLLASCSQKKSDLPCLAEDLGQYAFLGMEELPGGGCRARYRSPQGGLAEAEVVPAKPDLFGTQGRPVKFEKHTVRERRAGEGTVVGWHSRGAGVSLVLHDQALAQGPVLRAYLFRYPSDLREELEQVEQQTEQLIKQARQRPEASRLHLEAARNFLRLGKEERALQELHAALDADRTCADCYREFYDIFKRQKQWDLAIRCARRLEELEPQSAAVQVMLGDIYFQVRNGPQALRSYRRASQIGLSGAEAERVAERLRLLEAGQYMIEMVRPPRQPAPSEQ